MESGPLRRQRDWLALVAKPSFVTLLSQSGAITWLPSKCPAKRCPGAWTHWGISQFWLALRWGFMSPNFPRVSVLRAKALSMTVAPLAGASGTEAFLASDVKPSAVAFFFCLLRLSFSAFFAAFSAFFGELLRFFSCLLRRLLSLSLLTSPPSLLPCPLSWPSPLPPFLS